MKKLGTKVEKLLLICSMTRDLSLNRFHLTYQLKQIGSSND